MVLAGHGHLILNESTSAIQRCQACAWVVIAPGASLWSGLPVHARQRGTPVHASHMHTQNQDRERTMLLTFSNNAVGMTVMGRVGMVSVVPCVIACWCMWSLLLHDSCRVFEAGLRQQPHA